MQATTLRPGLLVSVKTSIKGNVKYMTNTLEYDHIKEDGSRLAKWETERVISDPAEHEAAVTARSLARSKVTGVCAQSAFGLLCPESKADQLDKAIAEARFITEKFNMNANLTSISFYAMVGKVAPDDAEAIRAINSEMRDLMEAMEEGLRNLNAVEVKKAATKAKAVGAMLAPEAQERIQAAIDIARKAARQIVKAGETGAAEIDRVSIARIQEARTGFLDLNDAGEVQEAEHVARQVDMSGDSSSMEPLADTFQTFRRDVSLDDGLDEEPELVIAMPARKLDLD